MQKTNNAAGTVNDANQSNGHVEAELSQTPRSILHNVRLGGDSSRTTYTIPIPAAITHTHHADNNQSR